MVPKPRPEAKKPVVVERTAGRRKRRRNTTEQETIKHMNTSQQNWAIQGRRVERHWTSVPHSIMRDPELSPISKVVWVILHGYAPHFSWTKDTIAAHTGVGGHQLRKAFRELQAVGLLERRAKRQSNGTIEGWEWSVHETIDRVVENLPDGHRVVENLPDGEEPCGRFSNALGSKTYQTVEHPDTRIDAGGNELKNPSQNIKEEQSNIPVVLCMEFAEFESMSIDVLHGVNLAHPPMRSIEVLKNNKREDIENALRQTAKATRPSWAYFAAVLEKSGKAASGSAVTDLEREQARMYQQIKDGGGSLTERQQSILNKVNGGQNA